MGEWSKLFCRVINSCDSMWDRAVYCFGIGGYCGRKGERRLILWSRGVCDIKDVDLADRADNLI
jgi:hypothetical protein